MKLNDLRRAGDLPSLLAALIHFDVSCMVWTVLGALGIYIGQALHLSSSELGLVVGTPLVAAAVARVLMGIAAAGNAGTVVCILAAPRLAQHLGWHAALGIAAAPIVLAVKLAKGFLGTDNVDSNSRLCMSSAVAAYNETFGADGPPPSYADIEEADCFLLLGSNAAACHPTRPPTSTSSSAPGPTSYCSTRCRRRWTATG